VTYGSKIYGIRRKRKMNEIRIGDYYPDIDKDGYVRIHQYDLGQLIKQANGAYNMLKDVNALLLDISRWRRTAEVLARELGNVGIALGEYEHQKDGL
jgi:hypothetical protein